MAGDAPAVLLALAMLCGCAITMTATLLATATELRRTLRRLNSMLPQCEAALRQANALLTRTNHATRDIERLIRQATDAARGWIQQAVDLKRRAHAFMTERLWNGHRAGAEPRRTARRHHQ